MYALCSSPQQVYAPFRGLGDAAFGPGFANLTSEVRPFRGARDTLSMMSRHALGDYGERSMVVHGFAKWITRFVEPKDYLGEIIAVRNAFVQPSPFVRVPSRVPLWHYTNDPLHVEVVKTPERQIREIDQLGSTSVDCDEIACTAATMLLQHGRAVQFVALGFEPDSLTHVGVRAREPKSEAWVWLDGVAGPREAEAVRRAHEILVWNLE